MRKALTGIFCWPSAWAAGSWPSTVISGPLVVSGCTAAGGLAPSRMVPVLGGAAAKAGRVDRKKNRAMRVIIILLLHQGDFFMVSSLLYENLICRVCCLSGHFCAN